MGPGPTANRGRWLCLLTATTIFLSLGGAPRFVDATPSIVSLSRLPENRIWTPGIRTAKAPGPWVRELERRAELLRKHRGQAQAVIGLLGLLQELHGEIPAKELLQLLSQVSNAPSHHPLVKSFAQYLYARVLELEGLHEQASQLYEQEGFLLNWQIVGPFDNSARSGHSQAFAPEQQEFLHNFSLDQQFVGKLANEKLTWRPLNHAQAPRGALISLDDLLDPNEQVTGYATTWVHVDRDEEAVLHVGSGGPYKIWIDGQRMGEENTYRAPHPLQDAHGIHLHQGWNRILFKLSCDEGIWGFYARISSPTGAGIKGLKVAATLPNTDRKTNVASKYKSNEPRFLRQLLTKKAKSATATASDQLALMEFYRWVHPFAPEDREVSQYAQTADQKIKSSHSAYLLALAEQDPARSRQALQRGIERASQESSASAAIHAKLLVELAWREQALGLDRRARELLAQAYRLAPDDVMIELEMNHQLAEDGFPLNALEWFEDILRRYPHSTLVQSAYASQLLDIGRMQQGLQVFEKVREEHGLNDFIFGQMVHTYMRRGMPEKAIALSQQRIASAPGNPDAYRQLAHLEESRGNFQPALAALQKAASLAPQDAELHGKMGRLLARLGDTEASIRSLRRSLDLKPQQPAVRELLTSLDKQAGQDLLERYDVDLSAIAKHAIPATWKGKSAGILHQRVAVRVLANGLSERLEHRIIRVLDDRGIRGQVVQAISFDPAESYVDVRRARVLRNDGRVEEIGDPRVIALSEAGFRMYYDQRQQQVIFSGLQVGDTLEVAFVRHDVAPRNKFDDYFGDMMAMDDFEPSLHSEYILEAPAERKLFFNVDAKRSLSGDGKTAIYRYLVSNPRGIVPEANMPGWAEIARYLHMSTYSDWDSVGRWYWNLVKDQLVVDQKIREGLQQALTDLPKNASERERAYAIYRHVITATRYVGLEFGIHGFKPYRTTDVYDRRFGDCKDKASLLKVMLEEAGIPSFLTLVRTRDQGQIANHPASLAAFNHAIVYIPSLDLYLDGTAEYAGPEELPLADQGANALIIKDGKGADMRIIPMGTLQQNVQHTKQVVQLSKEGNARVHHDFQLNGSSASGWRAQLQSDEQRKERLLSLWSHTFPGTVLRRVATPGIENVLVPVRVDAELEIPGWGQTQGQVIQFPTLGYRSNLVRSTTPQGQRKHDLMLSSPSLEIHEIEYNLPTGYGFKQIPSDREISSPFGYFQLSVVQGNGKVVVKSRLEYRSARIRVDEYRQFREFLRQVDAGLGQTFEYQRQL